MAGSTVPDGLVLSDDAFCVPFKDILWHHKILSKMGKQKKNHRKEKKLKSWSMRGQQNV